MQESHCRGRTTHQYVSSTHTFVNGRFGIHQVWPTKNGNVEMNTPTRLLQRGDEVGKARMLAGQWS